MPKPKSKYAATALLIDGAPNLTEIAALSPGPDAVVAYDNVKGVFTLSELGAGLGMSGDELIATGTNTFETFAVSGQSDVVADSPTDTLTLVAGANMTITTDAGTDTITFAASGGGGGDATSTFLLMGA